MLYDNIKKKIIAHGHVLKLTISEPEPVYLKRSTLISSSRPIISKPQKFGTKWSAAKSFFLGAPLSVNHWTCKGSTAEIKAGLGYFGEVIEVPVKPDEPVFINTDYYLGHRGALGTDTQKIAKKEFWFMTKMSGTGSVILHVPVGCEGLRLADDVFVLDHRYAAAIWGDFDITGQELDVKSWAKSGETDNVIMSGQCELILSKAKSSSQSSSGIIGSLLNIFT